VRITASIPLPFGVLWRSCVTGVFGAASGFAVFVLLFEEKETRTLLFFGGLLVAATLSFVFESFRSEVERRPDERRDVPDVLVTVALLAVFELFILAFHKAFDLVNKPELKSLADLLLGTPLAEESSSYPHLAVMAGLWMFVAMVFTVGLSIAVFHRACELPESYTWRAAAVPTLLRQCSLSRDNQTTSSSPGPFASSQVIGSRLALPSRTTVQTVA